MNWELMETAPTDRVIQACGFRLERFSGLREELTIAIIRKGVGGSWFIADESRYGKWIFFEPLGWAKTPELMQVQMEQPKPKGQPKFKLGEKAKFKTRYYGILEVRITAVIGWPSGWWYGLDNIDNPGHGNPRIGTDKLEWDGDDVFSRPASEDELIQIEEA